jgi:hypothetical protein
VTLAPRAPQAGAPLEARVEAIDPDGDALRLRYSWSVGDELVPARGPSIAVPDAPKGTPIQLEVVANDGRLDSEPARVSARVGNRAPVMASVRLDPQGIVKAGETVVAIAAGRDPDGDSLRYRYEWSVNGTAVDERGERLAPKGLKRGDKVAVRVTVDDGEAESTPLEGSAVEIGNAAPEITSLPGGLSPDGVLRYTVEARDADGDRGLHFRLDKAPEGARIDPLSGQLEWKASAKQLGTHEIEVVVEDGHGGEGHQRFEVNARVADEDLAATEAPANEE